MKYNYSTHAITPHPRFALLSAGISLDCISIYINISTEEFRFSRVNLQKFRRKMGQIMQFAYIGLPTLDFRCFQRNFSHTLSRFTLDNRNSSVLLWCHPLGSQVVYFNTRCFRVKWIKFWHALD